MELSLQKLSKAFNGKPVFEDLNLKILTGDRLAIAGPNGAGKSTLLKIISGGMLPTSGTIQYFAQQQIIPEDRIYQYVHFVAPYNTVIEELTLPELFQYHQRLDGLKIFRAYHHWTERLQYEFPSHLQIKSFSSGMKQRVKLGLVLFDRRPLILLDEPSTNLDAAGKEWFFNNLPAQSEDITVVIATNDPREVEICSKVLELYPLKRAYSAV